MKTQDNNTGQDSPPAREIHTPIVPASGEQAVPRASHCELRSLLQERRKSVIAPQEPGRACQKVRILLMDGDESVIHAVRDLVEGRRDGWILKTCPAFCPARAASLVRSAWSGVPLAPDHSVGFPTCVVLAALGSFASSRLGCVRKVKALAPELPVVIISDVSDESSLLRFCLSGADGWLTKPVSPQALEKAIISVLQGVPAFSPEALTAILKFLRRLGTAFLVQRLSHREQEIGLCLAEGLSDKEIAVRLKLKPNTVHVHLVRLYAKLRVHSRAQVVGRLLGRCVG